MKKITLKFKFMALMLTVSVLLVLFSLLDLYTAFEGKAQIEHTSLQNEFVFHLNQATSIQALERGVGNTIIGGNSGLVEKFNKLGIEGDKHIRDGEKFAQMIIKHNFLSHDFQQKMIAWQQGYADLKQARSLVKKHGINSQDWLSVSTNNILNEFTLRDVSFIPHDKGEAIFYFNTVTRSKVIDLAEFAGRERALIGHVIASKKVLSDKDLDQLSYYRIRVDVATREILMLKNHSMVPPTLKASIENFEDVFVNRYEKLRQSIYQLYQNPRPPLSNEASTIYALSSSQWIAQSTQAIDAALEISSVIGKLSAQHIQTQQERNNRRVISSIALVIFVMACLYLLSGQFYVIQHKMKKIIVTLRSISKGTYSARVKGVDRTPVQKHDEIDFISLNINIMASNLELSITRINAAKEDAERASRVKSDFLASISHELRTPMNAILGFSQMLQLDPKVPLTQTQNEYVGYIMDGGNHLLSLINDLLDLSKIEADQATFILEEIQANDTVDDCITMITPLGQASGITIMNELVHSTSSVIRTDQRRLKQVLINLLNNAIKYNTNNGSIVITGTETDHDYLRISIKDTGVGIAQSDHKNVFQMFHRSEINPMIKKEGTGVGLAVTKLLIERMGGQIGFESDLGKGSTFWFDLPLASNTKALIWTDAMFVGVDSIDKDHQRLAELVNKLSVQDIDGKNVHIIIDDLINYTLYHFKREEILMKVCGYPDFENHVKIHKKLARKVSELSHDWGNDPSLETLDRLRDFIKNWLFNHIIKVDTAITPYTHGKSQQIELALKVMDVDPE